jgi:hypothetical protein
LYKFKLIKLGTEESAKLFNDPVIQQNDAMVIDYIRKYHLIPPPHPAGRLTGDETETSEWAAQLKAIFGNRVRGA